jgi:hypothetical protein
MTKVYVSFLFVLLVTSLNSWAQMPSVQDLWFHSNQGQVLNYDLNAYISEKVPGKAGFDTGLTQQEALPEGQADIIIAVLDTGADTSHAFIKNSLAKNSIECNNGSLPFKATEDRDLNGIKGDCLGVDFTKTAENPDLHRVADVHGHGTHVAGVIASFARYSTQPLFQRIKILPLRVIGAGEEGFSSRIIRALDYAHKRGARVVNFSMGWPQTNSNHSPLKEAISKAQRRGMIIVAAAGNNSHNSALYPCNYDGVICVGSSQNDGKTSRFSNFGAHVDFAAPGSQIISSIPFTVNPQISSLKGYDLKSGTSQASPIIATYVAAVLAQNPNFTREDVYFRLAAASQSNGPSSLQGFPEFRKILEPSSHSLITPIFKDSVQTLMQGMSLKLPITFQKFGSSAATTTVSFKLLSPGFKLDTSSTELSFTEGHTKQVFELPISCLDLESESFLKLQVTLIENGMPRDYVLNTQIMRSGTTKKIPGNFKASELGRLYSLNSKKSSSGHNFFISLNGNVVRLLERRSEGLVVTGIRELEKDEVPLFPSSQVLDLDGDGEDDVFFVTKKTKDLLSISYLSKDLTSKLQFDYLPEAAVFKGNQELAFLNYSFNGSKIKVPFFIETGSTSTADFKFNAWDFKRNLSQRNIYWLEPLESEHKKSFRTRTLTHPEFRESVLEAASNDDVSSAEVVSLAIDHEKLQFLMTIKDQDGIPLSSASVVLNSAGSQPKVSIISIEGNRKVDDSGLVFPIEKAKDSVLFVSAPKPNEVSLYLAHAADPMKFLTTLSAGISDEFLDVTSATMIDGHIVSYLQTKNTIMMYAQGSTPKSRPIIRHSFLDGSMVSEYYSPVLVSSNFIKPALYVDQSFVNGNGVYVLSETNGDLRAPVAWSLALPQGCATLHPGYDSSLGVHEVFFQCLDSEGNLTLRSHKLEM